MTSAEAEALDRSADEAAALLKVLSNPSRLRLLCALAGRPRCVGELEQMLGSRQSYVSGQLALLRDEGLVAFEREGRQVRYRLADPRVVLILERLKEVYCPVLN